MFLLSFDEAFRTKSSNSIWISQLGPEFVELCCVQKGVFAGRGFKDFSAHFGIFFSRKIPIWTSIFQMG